MKKVCSVEELKEGRLKKFSINGVDIAVGKSEDKVYATQAKCSHLSCPFSLSGRLKGKELTCLCHGSKFDIGSGEVTRQPFFVGKATKLTTYKAQVKGGDVMVEIE